MHRQELFASILLKVQLVSDLTRGAPPKTLCYFVNNAAVSIAGLPRGITMRLSLQ